MAITLGRRRGSGMRPLMGSVACRASADTVSVLADGCVEPLGALSVFGFGHAKLRLLRLPGATAAVSAVLVAIRGVASTGWAGADIAGSAGRAIGAGAAGAVSAGLGAAPATGGPATGEPMTGPASPGGAASPGVLVAIRGVASAGWAAADIAGSAGSYIGPFRAPSLASGSGARASLAVVPASASMGAGPSC